MPYANESSGKMTTAAQPQSKLEEIHDRLMKCNSEYVSLLSSLEDRLNKILDRKQPEKEKSEPHLQPQDAISVIGEQLNYFQSHNAYLSKLIDHIQVII